MLTQAYMDRVHKTRNMRRWTVWLEPDRNALYVQLTEYRIGFKDAAYVSMYVFLNEWRDAIGRPSLRRAIRSELGELMDLIHCEAPASKRFGHSFLQRKPLLYLQHPSERRPAFCPPRAISSEAFARHQAVCEQCSKKTPCWLGQQIKQRREDHNEQGKVPVGRLGSRERTAVGETEQRSVDALERREHGAASREDESASAAGQAQERREAGGLSQWGTIRGRTQ